MTNFDLGTQTDTANPYNWLPNNAVGEQECAQLCFTNTCDACNATTPCQAFSIGYGACRFATSLDPTGLGDQNTDGIVDNLILDAGAMNTFLMIPYPPPPPSPPPSPSPPPPVVEAVAELFDLFRLPNLTAAEQATVRTVATTATATTSVVAAGAAAAGGAGAALPIAFALQRSVMFSNLAGRDTVMSGIGREMRWTLGQFGIFSSSIRPEDEEEDFSGDKDAGSGEAGSGVGRRLQGRGKSRRRRQQELLASPLLLSLTDFGIIFGVVSIVHLTLLLCWRRCLRSLQPKGEEKDRDQAALLLQRAASTHLKVKERRDSKARGAENKKDDAALLLQRAASARLKAKPPLALNTELAQQKSAAPADDWLGQISARFGWGESSRPAEAGTSGSKAKEPPSLPASPPPSPPFPGEDGMKDDAALVLQKAASKRLKVKEGSVKSAVQPNFVDLGPKTTPAPPLARRYSTKREMKRSVSAAHQLTKQASSSTVAAAKKVKEMPSGFRPLPAALIWPNVEVMIFVFFTAGVVESSAAILSATGPNGEMDDVFFISLAAICVSIIFLFLTHELCRIRRFYRAHSSTLWTPSPVLKDWSEVDDPLMRLLARLHLIRPRMRYRGSYDPPEEDVEEPARSQRSLQVGEALSMRSHKEHPGDVFGKLSGYWLADVGGGRRGAAYHISKASTQAMVALFTGLGATAAALRSEGKETKGLDPGLIFAVVVSSLQILLGLFFLLCGPSGDRIEGAATGLEFVLFGIASAVSYAAGGAGDSPGLQQASTTLLIVAPCIAVGLSFYDVFLLPMLAACQSKDSRAGCRAGLYAALLLPFEVIMSQGGEGLGSSGGNVVSSALEMEGQLAETGKSVAGGASKHNLLALNTELAQKKSDGDDFFGQISARFGWGESARPAAGAGTSGSSSSAAPEYAINVEVKGEVKQTL